MKFSVVIPCHNAGRWIGEALRSVAAQTRLPHEIIVIDDASTDDSLEQIHQSRVEVRVLQTNCRNAAAARNAGIEAASGDWIGLLDADDSWDPNHLERAATVLGQSKDVAYRALCDEMTIDGVRTRVTKPQPIAMARSGISHLEYIEFENQELYFGHSSCVIRRDRLRDIGGYNPEQVRRHDIDMWLRLIHNQTWSWDSAPTVAYRVDTPGSICRNYAECEYYYLKALIRNKDSYSSAAMDALLMKIARKVMTLGFVDVDSSANQSYRDLAWPYLSHRVRMAYSCAELAPRLARRLIRLKRSLFTWRTGCQLPVINSIATRLSAGSDRPTSDIKARSIVSGENEVIVETL
jgi:glycosyltransferase involved in cell wall biosynthesis